MRTHTISKLRPVTIAAQQLKTRLRKAGPAQPDVEACSSNAANALTMCVSASVNMINGKKHRSGLSTTYALASISGKDLQSQRIAPVFHADAGRPFRPIAVMAEQLKVIPRETVFAQPVTHMETRANGGGVFMPSAIDVINGQELCSSLSAILACFARPRHTSHR